MDTKVNQNQQQSKQFAVNFTADELRDLTAAIDYFTSQVNENEKFQELRLNASRLRWIQERLPLKGNTEGNGEIKEYLIMYKGMLIDLAPVINFMFRSCDGPKGAAGELTQFIENLIVFCTEFVENEPREFADGAYNLKELRRAFAVAEVKI